MNILKTKADVDRFLSSHHSIYVYGARFKLRLFIELLKIYGYSTDYITKVLVSTLEGNPYDIEGLPVEEYRKEDFIPGDVFLMTLAWDYIDDVSRKLESDGFQVYCITEQLLEYDIVDYDYIYKDVYNMMKDFTNSFSFEKKVYNVPVCDNKKYAWTCWWQGFEKAPDLIKACINSMKRYLPGDVELIVITKDNYSEYLEFPDYILEKLADGRLTITTFSDIIRASLLYKYGGIWIDSTVLFSDYVPGGIWDYGIFTLKEMHYCLPFIGGKKGQKFYKFLMEGFFYYYKKYDTTKYYLLVTYILNIAMDTFEDIREVYNQLPEVSDNITNISNFETLSFHVNEKYTPEIYNEYMEGIYVHKLQRRFERFGNSINDEDNIYHYILSEYL